MALISTTAVRCRTNPPDGGSATCGGSTQSGLPNSFSPLTLRSTTTSSSAVIACLPMSTGLRVITPSPPGAMRPVLSS
jgi:hypothetical protein